MELRPLGNTGLMVSAIGFGAIKLPRISAEEAEACIHRALDLGVNFIDTARVYGDSESKVGRALRGRRDQAIVATKTDARDAVKAQAELETSLRELRMDVIDLYQLHSVSDPPTWDKVIAPGGALEAALRAKEQGKVRHVGASVHRDLNIMRKVIECGQFETVMVAYSPLDQEHVEREMLPLARKHGRGVIVMKPLSGGLLVSSADSPQPEGAPDPIVIGSLRYILSNPAISAAIPGMQRLTEVEMDTAVGRNFQPMTEDERDALWRSIGGLRKEFRYHEACLQCYYCQPCPQGVPVPELFRALRMHLHYPEDVRYMGLELYRSLEIHEDACEECAQCITKCPAGINIPERLKEVTQSFNEQPAP